MDAIGYAQSTLKNNGRVAALLGVAEKLSALQKRLEQGGNMTKEETGQVQAVSGEMLFGYDEAERIRRLNAVSSEVQTQIREKTAKATQFKEAIKKMVRKQEKDQATAVVL